jgi:hypothetical protein
MATTNQVPVNQTVTEQTKVRRPRRTVSVGFDGPDDSSLRITVKVAKDGTAKTWVTHKTGKTAKAQRGQTEHHASLAKATEAMERLVEKAAKLGWAKRVRTGFVARPDAFSELPAPAKTKAKK